MLSQDQTSHPLRPTPFNDVFTVGHLIPRQQKLSRLKRSASVTLPLVNESESVATLWLTGQGQTGHCHFEFEAPARSTPLAPQLELRLGPGESTSIRVRLTVPPPPFLALHSQKHSFVVTTTLIGKQQLSRSVLGWVETKPLIDGWLMSGLLAALVVWLIFWGPAWPSPYAEAVKLEAPAAPLLLPASGLAVPTPAFLAGNQPPESPAADRREAVTYRALFEEAAAQYQLDWRILAEVAYRESGFNPWAIGRHNEMGLMQIRPSTWAEWAPQVGVVDPYDPRSNILVGAAYLAYLDDFSRSWGYPGDQWMLVGYNWGPNNLRGVFAQQTGWAAVPEKTRSYAETILQFGPEVYLRRQEQLDSAIVLLEPARF
ncbi:MAG TPA: transglycosylase SLT domain-containing protein [Anaerolineae bacterium]|nr:transglycosylase SLT domain-containing protein [Anaerolineae bacterium]